MLSFGSVNLWSVEKLDLGDLYRWANDENFRRLLAGLQRPQSMPEIEAWVSSLINDPCREMYSVKTASAEMVGCVNFFSIDRRVGSADLGIVIDEDHWGRGYGHHALIAAVTYAFEDQRWNRLQAEMVSVNTPSKNLFEKAGFVKEGVRRQATFLSGRYLDIDVYGLLRSEFQRPVPPSAEEMIEEAS